jgi:hypothetical protein
MGAPEIERFLTDLAVNRHVSASTQNQAFSALLFHYQRVLGIELPRRLDALRAKRPTACPPAAWPAPAERASPPGARLGPVEQVGGAGGGGVEQVAVFAEGEGRQLVKRRLLPRVDVAGARALQAEGAVLRRHAQGVHPAGEVRIFVPLATGHAVE